MGKNIKHKKQQTESIAETFLHFGTSLSDLIACIYMLLILVLLPLYNEEGYSHIGTDKAMFFRKSAVQCGIAMLLVLAVTLLLRGIVLRKQNGAGNIRKPSCTDFFALAYGISVLLSYITSPYRQEALWGADGWYMGTLTQLLLVFSYFYISRCWKRRKWLLFCVLPVSTVVFVLGYLNRFGIFPIDMKIQNVLFISTIGNVNWYCGYLMAVFWGGVFLLWKVDWEKRWQKLLLMLYALIGFATLVTHGSSSSVPAMAGVILLTFCLSVSEADRMEAFWLEMCLLSFACLITFGLRHYQILTITFAEESNTLFTGTGFSIFMTIVSLLSYTAVHFANRKHCYPGKLFVILKWLLCGGLGCALLIYLVALVGNTLSGGKMLAGTVLAENPMFLFTPGWGSNRGATWTAGVQCFGEQDFLHKLTGVGPDCMSKFIYTDGSNELLKMVQDTFGTARLTNAHNEWLNILVNMGVLGFVSYVGMMVSAIWRYLRGYKKSALAGACGMCLLAYTLNNMFSFQQSMSAATIFIVLAVGEAYLHREEGTI